MPVISQSSTSCVICIVDYTYYCLCIVVWNLSHFTDKVGCFSVCCFDLYKSKFMTTCLIGARQCGAEVQKYNLSAVHTTSEVLSTTRCRAGVQNRQPEPLGDHHPHHALVKQPRPVRWSSHTSPHLRVSQLPRDGARQTQRRSRGTPGAPSQGGARA